MTANESNNRLRKFNHLKKSGGLCRSIKYLRDELPRDVEVVSVAPTSEADAIEAGFAESGFRAGTNQKICIDITGFMRPHILYFLKFLKSKGVHHCDMIYSEPERYSRRADTVFRWKTS